MQCGAMRRHAVAAYGSGACGACSTAAPVRRCSRARAVTRAALAQTKRWQHPMQGSELPPICSSVRAARLTRHQGEHRLHSVPHHLLAPQLGVLPRLVLVAAAGERDEEGAVGRMLRAQWPPRHTHSAPHPRNACRARLSRQASLLVLCNVWNLKVPGNLQTCAGWRAWWGRSVADQRGPRTGPGTGAFALQALRSGRGWKPAQAADASIHNTTQLQLTSNSSGHTGRSGSMVVPPTAAATAAAATEQAASRTSAARLMVAGCGGLVDGRAAETMMESISAVGQCWASEPPLKQGHNRSGRQAGAAAAAGRHTTRRQVCAVRACQHLPSSPAVPSTRQERTWG